MPIQFETHRNCITNDLFTTVQLLDAVPAMRLAADLSHYVVDREMPCPPPPPLQALITKVSGALGFLPGPSGRARSNSDSLGFSAEARNGWNCSAAGGGRDSTRGTRGIGR